MTTPGVGYLVHTHGSTTFMSSRLDQPVPKPPGLVDGVTAASDPLHLLDAGPLTTTAIAEGPVVITMPNAHPQAGRDRLGLEDLVDARWIDAPDTATPLTQLRTIARADGFHASLRYDRTDVHALLALVSAGGGLALLPQPVVQGRPDLAGVPLATAASCTAPNSSTAAWRVPPRSWRSY